MSRFGLASLIRPTTRAAFLSAWWPSRPHVSHGPLRRLGPLPGLPELRSVAALCAVARSPVVLFGRKGFRASLRRAPDALPFYEAGETLYFVDLDKDIPALRELKSLLAADLGLAAEHVSCEAFASKHGSGSSAHFDFDSNFNVQLRGRKRWRLAENRDVADPLESYVMGNALDEGADVALYAKRAFPRRMPARARRIEMREGSVLFLPRGYWHETRVVGESFALGFSCKPPAFRDLLGDLLRRRLTLLEGWRSVAAGMEGSPRDRARLRGELRALLPGLARLVAELRPEDLVGPRLFRWPAGARRTVADGAGGCVLTVRCPGRRPAEVRLDRRFFPLLRWLAGRKGTFRPPSVAGLDREEVLRLLALLCRHGALSGR